LKSFPSKKDLKKNHISWGEGGKNIYLSCLSKDAKAKLINCSFFIFTPLTEMGIKENCY